MKPCHAASVTYEDDRMNIRRFYIPDSIVFITQVVNGRQPVFSNDRFVNLLRDNLHETKKHHPFQMRAYVFLPDHFHLLIRPVGSTTFSQIMHSFKPNFTKAYKRVKKMEGSLQFWQKRFWDHVIRDEDDFKQHFDYIHYNPVKHRLVFRPEDWPHSSYHYWQTRGYYPAEWGALEPAGLEDIKVAGE